MISNFLDLLDRVRQNKPNEYMARCPAHNDRSPSLSVKDCDDGRILIHCFSGCSPDSIVSSLGLTLADLMPPKAVGHHYRPQAGLSLRDVLEGFQHEIIVAALIVDDLAKGRPCDQATEKRLFKLAERLNNAMNATRTPRSGARG